jgi:hypothetical protein
MSYQVISAYMQFAFWESVLITRFSSSSVQSSTLFELTTDLMYAIISASCQSRYKGKFGESSMTRVLFEYLSPAD